MPTSSSAQNRQKTGATVEGEDSAESDEAHTDSPGVTDNDSEESDEKSDGELNAATVEDSAEINQPAGAIVAGPIGDISGGK